MKKLINYLKDIYIKYHTEIDDYDREFWSPVFITDLEEECINV